MPTGLTLPVDLTWYSTPLSPPPSTTQHKFPAVSGPVFSLATAISLTRFQICSDRRTLSDPARTKCAPLDLNPLTTSVFNYILSRDSFALIQTQFLSLESRPARFPSVLSYLPSSVHFEPSCWFELTSDLTCPAHV